MTWEIATAQSLGARTNQEDAMTVLDQRDRAPLVLALADGAGGHADGEKASQAAIGRIRSEFAAAPQDAPGAHAWIKATIAAADRDVGALGVGQAVPRTTIVLVWINGPQGFVSHIGDSRFYHFRDGKAVFRSKDHSMVQLLLDMGRLKESELRDHPDRSRLLKALGGNDGADAEIEPFELSRGDGLALCSDGVWEHVETAEIEVALRAPALDRAAEELVATAVKRGGSGADNATLILARMR